MMRQALMSGLGLGYAPVASGTWGSAGAIVLAMGVWWGVTAVGGSMLVWSGCLVVLALLATLGCGRWGRWAVEHYAGKERKKGDPGQVVLDEWAGQWVALVALPMAEWRAALAVFAVQFFLFRVFDVLKPPPARQLEKLPHGWGIVADDLMAGVYANVVGQLVFRLFWVM